MAPMQMHDFPHQIEPQDQRPCHRDADDDKAVRNPLGFSGRDAFAFIENLRLPDAPERAFLTRTVIAPRRSPC